MLTILRRPVMNTLAAFLLCRRQAEAVLRAPPIGDVSS